MSDSKDRKNSTGPDSSNTSHPTEEIIKSPFDSPPPNNNKPNNAPPATPRQNDDEQYTSPVSSDQGCASPTIHVSSDSDLELRHRQLDRRPDFTKAPNIPQVTIHHQPKQLKPSIGNQSLRRHHQQSSTRKHSFDEDENKDDDVLEAELNYMRNVQHQNRFRRGEQDKEILVDELKRADDVVKTVQSSPLQQETHGDNNHHENISADLDSKSYRIHYSPSTSRQDEEVLETPTQTEQTEQTEQIPTFTTSPKRTIRIHVGPSNQPDSSPVSSDNMRESTAQLSTLDGYDHFTKINNTRYQQKLKHDQFSPHHTVNPYDVWNNDSFLADSTHPLPTVPITNMALDQPLFDYMNTIVVNRIILDYDNHEDQLTISNAAVKDANHVHEMMKRHKFQDWEGADDQFHILDDELASRSHRSDLDRISKIIPTKMGVHYRNERPRSAASVSKKGGETKTASTKPDHDMTKLKPYPTRQLSTPYLPALLAFVAYFALFGACDLVSSLATSIYKSNSLLSSALTYAVSIVCAVIGPIVVNRVSPLLLVAIISITYTIFVACNFTVSTVIVGGAIMGLGALMSISNTMFLLAKANYIAEHDYLEHLRLSGESNHNLEQTLDYIDHVTDKNNRVIRANLTPEEQARLKLSTDAIIGFFMGILQMATNLGSIVGCISGFCVLYFLKKPNEVLTEKSPLVINLLAIFLAISVLGNIIFFVAYIVLPQHVFTPVGTKSRAEIQQQSQPIEDPPSNKIPVVQYFKLTCYTVAQLIKSKAILILIWCIFSSYSIIGFSSGSFVSKSGMLTWIGVEMITLFGAAISIASCFVAFIMSKVIVVNTPQRARLYFALGFLLQAATVLLIKFTPVSQWKSKGMAWGITIAVAVLSGTSSCVTAVAQNNLISFLAYAPELRPSAFALVAILRSMGLCVTFLISVYLSYNTVMYLLLGAFAISFTLQVINCIIRPEIPVDSVLSKIRAYTEGLTGASDSSIEPSAAAPEQLRRPSVVDDIHRPTSIGSIPILHRIASRDLFDLAPYHPDDEQQPIDVAKLAPPTDITKRPSDNDSEPSFNTFSSHSFLVREQQQPETPQKRRGSYIFPDFYQCYHQSQPQLDTGQSAHVTTTLDEDQDLVIVKTLDKALAEARLRRRRSSTELAEGYHPAQILPMGHSHLTGGVNMVGIGPVDPGIVLDFDDNLSFNSLANVLLAKQGRTSRHSTTKPSIVVADRNHRSAPNHTETDLEMGQF